MNKHNETTDSTFLRHEPCEQCGSSDAKAVYDDGHTYCFSCESHNNGSETGSLDEDQRSRKSFRGSGYEEGSFIKGAITNLPKRGLTIETCHRWNYQTGQYGGRPCHIANFMDNKGNVVAQKLRLPNKNFLVVGDISSAGLYGSHLWNSGKKLVITEGELDALSVSQINEHRWPVVSLPNGVSSAKKVVATNLEYLNRFEEIIFMFDNDEVGQKAADECCGVLPVGKAKIAMLPLKDANEMLVSKRAAEVVQAIFNAKVYRPDGILDGKDLWDEVTKEIKSDGHPYPWEGLNGLTHGIRRGEIATFCAGSGTGKSQICKEIALDLVLRDEAVGYIALEENVRRTSLGVMGMYLNKPLHLDPSAATTEEKRKAFEHTVGSGKFFLYDHFGSMDTSNLLNRIRFMVAGCGCHYIFLDHLSIVVSGLEGGDERRLIDNTMTKLRSLVEELKFSLILVSHLKRPEGRAHEEGANTSLSQLRGSAGIAQLSDIVMGLERDQQDEDNGNTMKVRVLKNRWSGQTGVACELYYSHDTGRLREEVWTDDSTASGGEL